jgi:uncharacterized membrane protein
MAGRRPISAEALALASAGIAIIVYPMLAAGALERFAPRGVAAVALALLLGTLALRRRLEGAGWARLALAQAPGIALCALALLTNHALALTLLPAFVNLQLAWAFWRTLAQGPSMVERGAAFIQPHLPDFTRPYCRKVTALWALFFAVNAVLLAWLAFASPARLWPLYASELYFALVGALAISEFVVRKLLFRHYGRGPIDRAFAALFPARNTARGRRSQAYLAEMRRLGLKTD